MKERRSKKEEESGGESSGSVWTSFSDLFTSLAIIFLVMFIVAIIKLSMSSLDKKAYMEANISIHQKKKTDGKRKAIKNSLSKIDDYRETIRKKMDDMNQLVNSLEDHKKIMDDLIEEQTEKDTIIENAKNVIEKNNQKITELTKRSKKLDQNLEVKSKKVAQIEENLKELQETRQALDQKVKKQDTQNKKLKKNIQTFQAKVSRLDVRIEEAQEKLQKAIVEKKRSEEQINSYKKESLQKMMAFKSSNEKLRQQLKNETLKNQDLHNDIEKRENEISRIQNRYLATQKLIGDLQQKESQLNREIAGLKGQVSNAEGKYRDSLDSISKLTGQLDASQKSLGDYKSKYKNAQGEISRLSAANQKCDELGSKLSEIEGENKDLRDKLVKQRYENTSLRKEVGARKPAQAEACVTPQCLLAKSISKRLQKIDPRYKTDANGKLTLQMDDAFGFKNDSSQLKPGVKERIQKIVKIYSEELFRDDVIRSLIENIYIVGHASPRFRGAAVDPVGKDNYLAYIHNLDLSSARANQIVKFIFSKQMGEFKYKPFFKQKVFASGRGFAVPIPLGPGKIQNGCGKYDCEKSRRVEIFFTLKDANRAVASKIKVKESEHKYEEFNKIRKIKGD